LMLPDFWRLAILILLKISGHEDAKTRSFFCNIRWFYPVNGGMAVAGGKRSIIPLP
jgi:hypothetical protein